MVWYPELFPRDSKSPARKKDSNGKRSPLANAITVFIRLNAAVDKPPQKEAKLPINAAPNQKNAAFTRG